jgi:hypothetical protein
VLTTTLAAASANPAAVYGTEARVEIAGTFYFPTSLRVVSRTGEVLETFTSPAAGRGMQYEAAEVHRCLRAGLAESPLLPLEESLDIMGVLDEVRRIVGLDYAALTSAGG